MDRFLSGASTPGQGGPGSNDNQEVLYIPQSSKFGVSVQYIYIYIYFFKKKQNRSH